MPSNLDLKEMLGAFGWVAFYTFAFCIADVLLGERPRGGENFVFAIASVAFFRTFAPNPPQIRSE